MSFDKSGRLGLVAVVYFAAFFLVVCLADCVYRKVHGATVIRVVAGDDLQAKIDQAKCGDTLLLESGARFVGNFHGGPKGCVPSNQFLIAGADAVSLPAYPSIAATATMPALLSPNEFPSFKFDGGESNYKFFGVAFSTTNSGRYVSALITGRDVSPAPSNITWDSCYIHSLEDGTDNSYTSVKLGVVVGGPSWTFRSTRIALPGAKIIGSETFDNTSAILNISESNLVVDRCFVNSWFAPIFIGGGDLPTDNVATVEPGATLNSAVLSQVNNLSVGDLISFADDPTHDAQYPGFYQETARVIGITGRRVNYEPWAGNIGGRPGCTSDCGSPLKRAPLSPGFAAWNGRNPSFRLTRNTFWINPVIAQSVYDTTGRVPKGFLEIKAGDPWQIEGNDFTGWPATFAMTQHNQSSPAHGAPSPWSVLRNGVFRNNRVLNVVKPNGRQFGSQIFGLLLEDNVATSVIGGNILIENNLLAYGGWFMDLFGGVNVVIRRNTVLNAVGWANGKMMSVNYTATSGFVLDRNIIYNNEYGILTQEGATLPGKQITNNVLITETIDPYRPNCNNSYPAHRTYSDEERYTALAAVDLNGGGNTCPTSTAGIFVDAAAGNYRTTAQYAGVGADIDALETALGSVTPLPSPSPTPAPSPSPSPSASPTPLPSPSPSPVATPGWFLTLDLPESWDEQKTLLKQKAEEGYICFPDRPLNTIYCWKIRQ